MNKEIFIAAKKKSARLPINKMIRVTADKFSPWVFNFGNRIYIGYPVDEFCPNIIDESKPFYDVKDEKNRVLYRVQPL